LHSRVIGGRVNVYALGFSDGLTLDQRENRARLDRFIQLAADPDERNCDDVS
jgi:hypothetical protein